MNRVNRFNILAVCLLGMLCGFCAPARAAVVADDTGDNYGAGWTDGSNGGTGFGAWALSTSGNAAYGLGNPADSGITGMATNSFRMSGTNGYVDANRAFAAPLNIGDTFSLQWGNNWDTGSTNSANKGINLYAGGYNGTQLININMPNNEDISINGSPMFVNYGTAAITVYFQYVAAATLRVYGVGRDGVETYDQNFTIGGAPDAFRLYAGNMDPEVERYPYANNFHIEASDAPIMTLVGRTAMPANFTNALTVTRNGSTAVALDVRAWSGDEAVAAVDTNVTIEIGSNSAPVELVGVDTGTALIQATAAGFPTAALSVAVFDVAYDDSSYYPSGGWSNGANQGSGFAAWILTNNNGEGVGFTNYAGSFIGNSTADGGGNVNAQPTGDAFGLYANQVGTGGDPLSQAIRPFSAELAAGHTLSVDLGVNFRDGAKGVMIQSGDTWLFEVAVVGDDYVYQNHGGGGAQTSLGWTYEANTSIRVEVARKTSFLYDVSIIRGGTQAATNKLTGVNLGGAPDRVRFYNFNTAGGGGNNLFFNRLAIWSGAETPVLSLAGQEGMVVNHTNKLTVSRTGSTDLEVEVTLVSDNTGAVTVETPVTLGTGETTATADVVGAGRGQATITASATGFTDVTADIEVYDLAYDSSSYYGPGTFTNDANGGAGLNAWVISHNDGPHDGYTNFAGAFLGDSTASGGGDVNSVSNNAFGLYANQAGEDTGTNEPMVEATRGFTALAMGQSLTVDLGVNFRNGAKGMMLQSDGTWLFEVVVTADQYAWQNHALGGTLQDLGWVYAADSAINVTVTRVGQDKYDIALTRTGSAPEYMLLEGVSFNHQVPDRARFYAWNTEQGGENNLYVNRLGINEFETLEMEGVINIDVGGTTTIFIQRSDTTGPLTVDLVSAAPSVVTVPATVTFADGQAVTSFVANGVSESLTTIHADADGYVGAPLLVNVFDFPAEFDDAGNYIPGLIVPTTFTNTSNGGAGFGAWQFSALTAGAVIQLADSRTATAWMNSFNDRSFGFLGGSDSNYASAYRDLNTALAEGDKFECLLGMNWSGGNRGADLQDASGNKLFNFDLSYENISAVSFGLDAPVDLGWPYNATSVVQVVAEQLAGNQLSVTLTRNDGLTTNVVSTGLAAPVGRVNFYNGGHDGGSPNFALFANDLLITRGGGTTDGIPNAWWDKYGVAASNRIAAFDIDVDGSPNDDEFAGDTDPTDATRSFRNEILNLAGKTVMAVQVGPNTTNSRTYDVWWSTNLMAAPQEWTPYNLNAPAAIDGGALDLLITNDTPRKFFRSSVNIP
ncbi:MAG: hypothetical protein KA248_01575 [Kiritimatiellae bacterium]|nr:hypothetical protein [Kiritimatiellia bacterium]